MNLEKVRKVFKEWIYVEDDRRIDVALATALTRKMKRRNADMDDFRRAFGRLEDRADTGVQQPDHSKVIRRFTPKTLAPGTRRSRTSRRS